MKCKSILISIDTHATLKTYCKRHSLKLNDWVDKFINEYIRKFNEMDKIVPKQKMQ